MTYHIQLNMTIEPHALTIHNLRIQVPEPLSAPAPTPAPAPAPAVLPRDTSEAKEEKHGNATEYVAVSPRYTWSAEQVRSVTQDRLGELLWPVVMASHGLEVTPSKPLSLYSAFQGSIMNRSPENFPHHTLRDLMEYYIESLIGSLRGRMSGAEKDTFERRKMLRRMVLGRGMAWSPEYLDVYLAWTQTLPLTLALNRYQKIHRFVEEFFQQHT